MSTNFDKWIEQEINWINIIEKKIKKETLVYSLLMPVIVAVIFGVIGILVGGGIEGMLRNALIGIVFGLVIIPFFLLMMIPSYPAKRYKKLLKSEIEDVLTTEEKETFASQMSGLETDVKCITWKWEDKKESRVYVTKDFAMQKTEDGRVQFVQLSKVDKIKNEVRDFSFATYSGGFKTTYRGCSYIMEFYFKDRVNKKEDECDKMFVFNKIKDRHVVIKALKEVLKADQQCLED